MNDTRQTNQPNLTRVVRDFLIAAAIGLLAVGAFGTWGQAKALGGLGQASLDDALVLDATLELAGGGRSTAIAVRERTGSIFTKCYIGHCGYVDVREDFGKPVRVWILEGKVAQIEVDGKLKLRKEDVVARMSNGALLNIYLILSPICFLLGFIAHKQIHAKNDPKTA